MSTFSLAVLQISASSSYNIVLFYGAEAATRFAPTGNHKISVDIPATLNPGKNTVDLLSLTVGLAVSNQYYIENHLHTTEYIVYVKNLLGSTYIFVELWSIL